MMSVGEDSNFDEVYLSTFFFCYLCFGVRFKTSVKSKTLKIYPVFERAIVLALMYKSFINIELSYFCLFFEQGLTI